MAGPPDLQVCPACGSRLPAVEGPTHAYMTSSPACWAAFGEVMAREYADPALMENLFSAEAPADPFHRAAGHEQGAASILVGIAANESIAAHRAVKLTDLVPLQPAATRLSELV